LKEDSKGISLTILGLVLAGVGIVVPMAWDWWNSRCEMTITQDQVTNLVEKKADVKGLQIYYFGNVVTSLSKATFTLANTGHTPLTRADVVASPQVVVKNATFLSASIDRTKPANLGARLSSQSNTVDISFDLMNPGDSVTFSVLVDSPTPIFGASARIKNIPELGFVTAQKQLTFKKDRPWSVYGVGPLAIIFVIVGFGFLLEIPKKRSQIELLSSGKGPLSFGGSNEEFRRYIGSQLSFLTGSRKAKVMNLAERDFSKLTQNEVQGMASVICEQIKEEPSLGPALLSLVLGFAGLWYVVKNVIA
jgi:hypothetical protein